MDACICDLFCADSTHNIHVHISLFTSIYKSVCAQDCDCHLIYIYICIYIKRQDPQLPPQDRTGTGQGQGQIYIYTNVIYV